MENEVVLEVRDIVKDFPGLRANDHISFKLHKGEILAFLGENGAGKTTLMNVLMGILRADEGSILLHGKPCNIKNLADANRRGIGMAHQHFKLVHNFSVVDNIILGAEPKKGLSIDKGKATRRVKELSEKYGLQIDPNARIEKITVGMQQRTEILKMLYRDADILIFDEPTAVLMPSEIDELMKIMRNLAAQGKSIILITHKLKEIKMVADRCVIIRRGKVIDTVDVASTDEQYMADQMVGRSVQFEVQKKPVKPGKKVLQVDDLCVKGDLGAMALKHASMVIREGEIVGIAGVDGNGQNELVEAITGLRPCESGTITLNGKDITRATVQKRIDAGLSHIPEDRQRRGLIMEFPLEDNLFLGSVNHMPFSQNGMLKRDKIRIHSDGIIAEYDVRSSEGGMSMTSDLSGGNQQKAIVGREMEKPHQLLIAVQPTRGMDVGSIEYIHNKLLKERDDGKAILLVSLELDEVLQMSDRIIAISHGEFIGELSQDEANESNVGLMMAGIARKDDGNA